MALILHLGYERTAWNGNQLTTHMCPTKRAVRYSCQSMKKPQYKSFFDIPCHYQNNIWEARDWEKLTH